MANNNDKKLNKNSKSHQEDTNKLSEHKKIKPSKVKHFFKYFFQTLVITALVISVTGVGYVLAVIKHGPDLDVNSVLNLNQTSMLYDNKGDFIDNLPTEEERYIISYDKMPEYLKNAYIAIEDERFRTHTGIDVRRIIGAAVRDAMVLLKGNGGIHGASTITQQLIKNTILFEEASSEGTSLDSINRKIKEIYLSLKLERKLTKDQILEAYLNTIPLGGHVYGVEAASLYYFGKPAKEMSLIECAYIAGITQAPTYYSAYNTEEDNYPTTYLDRTKTVLLKMLELGFITQKEYDAAYAEVDANKFTFKPTVIDYRVNYEWFVYPALDQVKIDLKEKYKYTDEEISKLFVNGGLKIYLTMDKGMQDKTQSILNDRANFDIGNEETYTDEGVPMLQAAATVIDYRTGYVKTLVGGRGDQPAHSLNRAYDDLKSIASNTKPLTVYGPAIDTKIMTAATPIDDAPLSKEFLSKYGYDFAPTNFNGAYDGYISPRDAITYSKNITSLKTVDIIGLDTALDYGQRAGLVYNEDSKTLSALALGQFNNDPADRDGGNTTILASAFGAFGNNGARIEPILYTKVVDSTGKVLIEKKPTTVKLFSPQTAYIMYDILKEPVSKFDSSGAKFGDIPVAGKSGTTNEVDSFWFSGLTPYYSASVWIGYDMPTRLSGYSSAAANLWGDVMGSIHEGLKNKEIEKPSGIVSATVCKDSGKLATNLCSSDQRGGRVRTELFIEGTAPTSYCDVHVKVSVNRNNNKLATNNTPKSLIEYRVFIKKPYASSAAADYNYVVPTEVDNTREEEKVNLSQIGLRNNMDLFEAVSILNSNGINYTFKGDLYSGSLEAGQYTLVSFTKEIVKSGTVELKIKKINNSNNNNSNNSNNNNSNNNNSDNNTNNNDNNDNASNDNNNSDNASNDNADTNNDDTVDANGDNTSDVEDQE